MVNKHQVYQEEIYRPHFFADFSGKLPLPNFSFYKHVPPHASLYVKVIPMIITKVKTFLNVYNIIKQREKELTIDSSSGNHRSQTFEIDRNSRRNRFRWFLLPVRAVSDSIFRTLSAKKNISPFYDAISDETKENLTRVTESSCSTITLELSSSCKERKNDLNIFFKKKGKKTSFDRYL